MDRARHVGDAAPVGAPAGLIERGAELATLARVVSDCRDGSGELVLVRGGAGTGKSELLDTCTRTAEELGLLVLRARGTEFERDFPFGVVRQLFHALIRHEPRDPDARGLFDGPAQLSRTIFDGRSGNGDEPGLDDGGEATEVEGVAWLTSNVVGRYPDGVLLAVDDLHFADRASIRALAGISIRLRATGVVVLAAVNEDVGIEDEVLAWLIADGDAVSLHPAPLSESGIRQLVAARVGVEPDEAFVRACARATGGNPFLVTEYAGAVAAAGFPPTASFATATGRLVPDAVSGAVTAALARCRPTARSVAEAAAILGPDARLADVAALADVDAGTAAEDVERLREVGILDLEREATIRYPLIARALERGMGSAARQLAHGRAADLLLARGAAADRVAAQLLLAAPAGRDDVVDVLRSAAAAKSPPEAIPLLRRALDEPPTAGRRLEVLRELVEAEIEAADPSAAERLHELLEATTEPRERVDLFRTLARLHFLGSDPREAALTLRRAMAENAAAGLPFGSALQAEFDHYARAGAATEQRDLRADAAHFRTELFDRARAGDLPDDVPTLVHVAHALAGEREPRETVRRLVDRAVAAAGSAGLDPFSSTWAVFALVCADELPEAERLAERSWAAESLTGSAQGRAMAALARAGVAVATGSLDRALEAAETAARLAIGHAPSAAPWSAAMLACAQRERGELSAAARALTPLDTLVSDDMATAVAAETRAELHLARGHPRRAWDDALLAGTALGRCGAADYPLLPWRLTAAAAGVRSDKGERAAELAREELALARRAGAPRWIGRALVAISELPGEDEIARLEEAVATLADSHADLDRAVAAFRLGRALGHARRGPDAEASFGEALDLAERCGARQLAKDVRHALRDLGVKPRRRPEHGPAAMTGAEWRVARLAARHLTNREIATELHLTVSTVEYHLTRAFRKLEVESREGLAAALDGLDEGDR